MLYLLNNINKKERLISKYILENSQNLNFRIVRMLFYKKAIIQKKERLKQSLFFLCHLRFIFYLIVIKDVSL